jgi:hypothetical protein
MLDTPGILNPLNEFIDKKTATRMLAVCKIMNEYIKPKCYRQQMLKLDSLNILRIERGIKFKLTFEHIKQALVLFQNNIKIRRWTQRQYAIMISYTCYAYSKKNISYLLFNYYVNGTIQNILTQYNPESFIDYYNIIKKYPISILQVDHDYYEDEITYF